MPPSTLLVTGGAGFIGSLFVASMLDEIARRHHAAPRDETARFGHVTTDDCAVSIRR